MSTVEERFWPKVDKLGLGGCWLWTAATGTDGYGRFVVPGRHSMAAAHRVAYELLIGPIPDGLDVDHLCRNRACVNPSHLEPVTRSENLRRGLLGFGYRGTCRSGRHDVTDPANVRGRLDGGRQCRPCYLEAARVRMAELRARRRSA